MVLKKTNSQSEILDIIKNNIHNLMNSDGAFNLNKFEKFLDKNNIKYVDNIFTDKEKYSLIFTGKKYAIEQCNECVRTKVIPEEIHNSQPDNINSKNMYIVGDNLEAIKHLLKSYKGKIKCIYIDPPYNTGSENFAYNDKFKYQKELLVDMGFLSEDFNNKLTFNSVHSAWLTFMYPRIKLAKELLTDDGVMFISIDDNEVDNLKLICNTEIFGEENFVNCIAVKMSEPTNLKMSHQWSRFPKLKEYVLFYKNNNFKKFVYIDKYKQDKWDKENSIFLENMTYDIRQKLIKYQSQENYSESDIININNLLKNIKRAKLKNKLIELKLEGEQAIQWMFENSYRIVKTVGASSYIEIIKNLQKLPNQEIASYVSKDNTLFFYITDFNKTAKDPRFRVIFADENIYKNPCDFWQDIKTSGAIADEGGIKYPNGKKPLKMIERIIKMTTKSDDIVLDFFSGSSTTAHAVMSLNAKDGGKRKFIMVQIPEVIEPDTQDKKAYVKYLEKEGIKPVLSEIGIERIKRSAKKIKDETGADIDYGFKIYELKKLSS